MDLYSVSHNKKQGVEGQQAFAFSVAEHTKPGFKRNGNSRPKVFCKKVFLEISEHSQENTCARVSFSKKLQADLKFY